MKNRTDKERLERQILSMSGGEVQIWKAMVGSHPSLFEELYQLTFSANPKIAWRSAWIIDNCSEDSPALMEPFIPAIIERVQNEKSSSLKRHFTRILCRYILPENQLGLVVDVAVKLVAPSEAIAVRANAMQLLYNISEREPDLKPELIAIFESILEEKPGAGITSRARNLLKKLRAKSLSEN